MRSLTTSPASRTVNTDLRILPHPLRRLPRPEQPPDPILPLSLIMDELPRNKAQSHVALLRRHPPRPPRRIHPLRLL